MSTIILTNYNFTYRNIPISIRAVLPLWKAHRLYRNWKLVFHHDCMETVRYPSFLPLVAVTKFKIFLTRIYFNKHRYFSKDIIQFKKTSILLTLGRCLLKDSSLSMSYWVRCPTTLLSKVDIIKVHNKITETSSLGRLFSIFRRLIQSFSSTLCSHTYEPQYISINHW